MTTIAVIGLGYVGLPLVVEFGKHLRTIGFDIAKNKVQACERGTDPTADPEEAMHEYGVALERFDDLPRADAVVAAVAHREYQAPMVEELGRKMVKGGAFIDVKSAFDAPAITGAGCKLWRL